MVPVLGGTGYPNLHLSERWMIQILHDIHNESKGTFMDIGVNIGQTLIKLKSVQPEVDYIGFEPNFNCNSYVQQLIDVNSFQAELIPAGIFNRNGIEKLFFYYKNNTDGTASILQDYRPDQPIAFTKYIAAIEGSEAEKVLAEKELSVIKIDVEGAELEVLEVLAKIIEVKKPLILIEILPVYSEENKFRLERQNKIVELLKQINYSIYRIIKKDKKVIQLTPLNEFGIHSRIDHCDYLLSPSSKKFQFIDRLSSNT